MSMSDSLNIVVCVPSNGEWKAPFGHSLAMLFADFMLWKPSGLRCKLLQLQTQSSSMLVQSRHELVRRALKAGATHILFLDSDMVFQKDLLRRLLEAEKDIVGVNCTTRAFPVKHIAHGFDGKVIDSRGKTGLERVQHVGLAVMLIKAHVFQKLEPPFFMMEWIPEVRGYCGEDIYFCQLAQAAEFDVWVDHSLSESVRHVGTMSYGQDLVGEVGEVVAGVVENRVETARLRNQAEMRAVK